MGSAYKFSWVKFISIVSLYIFIFFPFFSSKAKVSIDSFSEKYSVHSFIIGKFIHSFILSANSSLGAPAFPGTVPGDGTPGRTGQTNTSGAEAYNLSWRWLGQKIGKKLEI